MVRILDFADQVQWVARLRLPDLSQGIGSPIGSHDAPAKSITEYNTIQLIQKETNIPVPRVHVFQGDPDALDSPVKIKTPFMLMDCLRGNVGMDLAMQVPSEYKTAVFTRLAEIQVRSALPPNFYGQDSVGGICL